MLDTLEKLVEHYRRLTAEEVAMAKVALTNETRPRHYAKLPIIGWLMQCRTPSCSNSGGNRVDVRPNGREAAGDMAVKESTTAASRLR